MEACVEFPTRSVARAKIPRVRSHGIPALPAPSMHATRPPVEAPAVARPGVNPAHANGNKPSSDEEISGTSGPAAPPPVESLPVAPASDPPASLDAPIDDVDGVLE